jgi:hypothetical protein
MAALLAGVVLSAATVWQAVHPGVRVHQTQMAPDGPLAPVSVVLLHLDPALLRLSLDRGADRGEGWGWNVDRLPAGAVAGFNAGQFYGSTPWGWLVVDGVEVQPPGTGTLTMSFAARRDGSVSLLEPAELSAARETVFLAFQSYPSLLVGSGTLPWELQAPGRGVDLDHRDSRLALGVLADGTLIVALTRFSAFGRAGETLPWGPTVTEMAEFMRSLGCVRAMLLDGGISSQMVLRGTNGSQQRWTNWRQVPLGLVVFPFPVSRR